MPCSGAGRERGRSGRGSPLRNTAWVRWSVRFLLLGRGASSRGGTGSWYGFLFSVPAQVEGLDQLQGGLVEGQVVEGCPEVENIAVGGAVGVEAAKDILAEVRGEGRLEKQRGRESFQRSPNQRLPTPLLLPRRALRAWKGSRVHGRVPHVVIGSPDPITLPDRRAPVQEGNW
jgi:hypothetical protein